MEGRRRISLGLMLTCLVAYCAGVDNDVQQVTLPNVVKFPLGPRMEVLSGGGPREMRAANFHSFPSGCLSCTIEGGFGSSSHGRGYRPGGLRPVSESDSSSHKHEVRTESKSVNGEPVYDMFHERRFEDGHLVHDERREKGSKDIDASFRAGEVRGYPEGSGYSRNVHETHVQSSSAGSSRQDQAGGNFALGETSLGLDSLSERLRQQMHLLQKGHDIPGGRGSHRAVFSERRYVNGQPVYEKKEERKYEDGQLIYNNTHEKGPDDLGTQHVAQQYDTAGALVGPSTGGVYERREEQRQYSSSSHGSEYYPQPPSGIPGGAGSSYSYWQEWHGSSSPSYRPSGGYSPQYTQESSRESYRPSYRPSYTPTSSSSSSQYSHESRGSSSYNPSYRPASSSSSSHYSHESSSAYRPSYRPSSSSSSSHYSQESSREESSDYRPSYRPSSGSSSFHYSQDSREESSAYRPSYRPSSSSSSSHYSHESRGESSSAYRPSSSSSSHYSQDSREDSSSNYRPSSSSSSSSHYSQDSREDSSSAYRPSSSSSSSSHYSQETQETSSAYRPSYRPAGSTSSVHTHESREESSARRPSHGISPTPYPEDTREESSSYRPYRPTGGSSIQNSQTREESREETYSNYRPYRPSSGSSSTYHSQTREESSSVHRPSYRPSSGGYSSSREETSRQESSTSYGNQPDRWAQPQQPSEDRYDSAIITQSREEQSSSYRPSTDRSTHYSQETNEESTSSRQHGYRQPVPSSNRREESYDSRWQGYAQTPSPDDYHSTFVQQNARLPEDTTQGSADIYRRGESTESHSRGVYGNGGARTTTLDLSSSSSASGSSFTDQLLGPSRGHGHDTEEEIDQISQSYEYNQQQDRFSSRRNQDSSSERVQSSRENTDRVGIPGVLSGPHTDNGNDEKYNKERYDISPLDDSGPALPSVDNEIDSSDFRTVGPVDGEVDSSFISQEDEETSRHGGGSRHGTTRPDTTTQLSPDRGYGESRYHYYENRTSSRETAGGVPAYGHSQVSETGDASSHTYPAVEGSTRYHYNESWRHSTSVDGHSQPVHGSSSTSSSTSQVSNCGQVNCVVVGDGQVTSSRRTQTRVSTRYVNGELVGITHHVRYYEDGRLVHENQTEKTIDELTDEDLRKYGIENLQLVQGSYQPESYSQRHEVRQEKKYVNGEQVYDLHHEKRFEDGGLVYENRTEKDENDFGVVRQYPEDLGESYSQSYHGADARHEVTQSQHLQQHVSSDTVGGIAAGTGGRTSETRQVTDTAHVSAVPVYTSHRYEARRQQEFVNGQPTYDLHHERRFKNGSLIYENKTELNEDDLQSSPSHGHYDALHQILAGQTLNTASESSYRGSSAASHGSSYGGGVSASHSSYGGSSLSQTSDSYSGSSATGSASSYQGSQSQQTGEYGGSASSQGGYYGSYSSSSSERHESRNPGIPAGATSGSSGATTTVLGGSSYSSSSQQESSSGGCLSCMLIGGSGYSSHGSVGASGGAAGGYSHRQEMSVEERYEDGQLVHGQEEERVFEDGQLVHENRRQYSDPSQSSHSSALQSASLFSRDGVVTGACDSSYCKNGGTCIPGYTGPLCTCPFGFKGHDCSEPFCPKRFCRYGGTCSVVGDSHMCSCQPGFAGYRCQTRTRRHARRHASKP